MIAVRIGQEELAPIYDKLLRRPRHAALLLVGGVAVAAIVASRRRPRPAAGNALSDAERHRLAGLLPEAAPSIEQDP